MPHPIKTPVEGQLPYKFIVAGAMGADFTSDAVDVSLVKDVCLQLSFAGTSPTGTFAVQVSLDNVTYTALSLVDAEGAAWTPAAAGDGTVIINLSPLPYPFLKVFFDRTSGTGALNGWVFGK
ncbi:MAG: hypothetical protein IPI28_18895 [Candidatus Omnitrophica bacterium]|nr:hypothetical protein [Candidatus Omnitrophota bacterium]